MEGGVGRAHQVVEEEVLAKAMPQKRVRPPAQTEARRAPARQLEGEDGRLSRKDSKERSADKGAPGELQPVVDLSVGEASSSHQPVKGATSKKAGLGFLGMPELVRTGLISPIAGARRIRVDTAGRQDRQVSQKKVASQAKQDSSRIMTGQKRPRSNEDIPKKSADIGAKYSDRDVKGQRQNWQSQTYFKAPSH
eukprot:2905464-Amphidinium_carterae.1